MTNVVSIKFKNRGKSYFFDPNGVELKAGDKAVVETSNGLELADCVREPHAVPDEAVVPPLRPVVRAATAEDLRAAENNKVREKEAFTICKKKIAEHGLEMKLIDAECNFEGTKTTFYFTSDGRVDFRELVKDLAGIFHNRIELRQIGVRDEAKMLGGIGMCGRPYCCNQYLDDFKPVSTKMAKVQNLSLNPTKISGSCGRLMCCLRYEQEAYDDLTRHVPRQGSFVETVDGYGTAVQINLLRQTVKVRLDSDGQDDSLHVYKAGEVAQVPGGRPKDGETPPSVLHYVPEEENTEEEPEETPAAEWEDSPTDVNNAAAAEHDGNRNNRRNRENNRRRVQAKPAEKDSGNQTKPDLIQRQSEENQKKTDESPRPAGEEDYKPVKVEVHRSRNGHNRGRRHGGNGQPRENGQPNGDSQQPKTKNQQTPTTPQNGTQTSGNQNNGEHKNHTDRKPRYGNRNRNNLRPSKNTPETPHE